MPRKPLAPPAHLFAGTSGWAYPTWKPGFYPADVSAKNFLSFYASRLTSVEVNYTFRKLPTETQLTGWLAATPESFRFSFKAPQRITHFSRLRQCEEQVKAFVASLLPARDAGRLGLLLFQLPPQFKADPARLEAFLALEPLLGEAAPRIAFEFRHESWFVPEVTQLLTTAGAALCIAESDDLQTPEVHTAATHTCFRLRRNGGYKTRELTAFASKLGELAKEREVYAYFKHEDEPTGALNAAAFLRAAAKLPGSAEKRS